MVTTGVPLLQLYGANDGRILTAQVDDRHRFASRRVMEVVPNVGHFLHIEAPMAIAERIQYGAINAISPSPNKRVGH
ncbi:hypothetical protein JV35_00885 [Pectobacterium betavasculorum]|uniref:Alpha/beta hydrolase n=1 Tax=Pectobacterium betavasculorum TaxID=55207 RepID=A0ABR4V2T6_9GAMM|nr:hypothetical protein JV35_00885 [Pectobacterium betavasculorum]